MYIRASILLLVALLLHTSNAYARLGETAAESKKQYGKPVEFAPDKTHPILPGAAHRTYKYKGWLVRVAFLKKKAARINYSKIDKPATSPVITDEETATVLKDEADKGSWKINKKATPHPLKSIFHPIRHPKKWINTNGNIAYLQTSNMQLVLESPSVETFLKQQATQAEAARKKDIPEF